MKKFFMFVVALSLALVATSAFAQTTTTGSIEGMVTDPNGAAVKGATVTADNEEIGQTFTATTDDKGRFNMLGLRSGNWRFIAQAPGYTPQGFTAVIRSGGQNMQR